MPRFVIGVKAAIDAAMERKVSKKPELPSEFVQTVSGRWYNTLTHQTSKEEVDKLCAWTKIDVESLDNLKKRLLTPIQPRPRRSFGRSLLI